MSLMKFSFDFFLLNRYFHSLYENWLVGIQYFCVCFVIVLYIMSENIDKFRFDFGVFKNLLFYTFCCFIILYC